MHDRQWPKSGPVNDRDMQSFDHYVDSEAWISGEVKSDIGIDVEGVLFQIHD